MKTESLKVKNMKCMGCVNTIQTGLSSLQGVSNVKTELSNSTVTFSFESDSLKEEVIKKLDSLGYPAV